MSWTEYHDAGLPPWLYHLPDSRCPDGSGRVNLSRPWTDRPVGLLDAHLKLVLLPTWEMRHYLPRG